MKPFDIADEIKKIIEEEKNKGAKLYKEWFNKSEIKSLIKAHYILEQEYSCCYCREVIGKESPRLWDLEHILPSSKHDEHICEPLNLAVACTDCNGVDGKYDTDVLETGFNKIPYPTDKDAFTIIHPHFDKYDDHLKKIGFSYEPVDESKKGINLIKVCKLDRYAKEKAGILGEMNIEDFSYDAMKYNEACQNNDRTGMAVFGARIASTFNGITGKALVRFKSKAMRRRLLK